MNNPLCNLTEESFLSDLQDVLCRQYERCRAYRKICDRKGYRPHRDLTTLDDLPNIPFVTSNSFKKSTGLFPQLLNVAVDELAIWTLSSSTSGDPSVVGRSKKDIALAVDSFVAFGKEFGHVEKEISLTLFPSPALLKKMAVDILGKRAESFIAQLLDGFGKGTEKRYLLGFDPSGGGFTIDQEALSAGLLAAVQGRKPTFLGGSAPIVYSALLKPFRDTSERFPLSEDSLFTSAGGGWDGRKGNLDIGERIEKADFVGSLCDIYDFAPDRILDVYGFTETPVGFAGHYSEAHCDFIYHHPPWCRVIVRDLDKLEPIREAGRRGLLEVITPYGVESYAGAAILIDDLVELVAADGGCPECGRPGTVFKVLGRAQGADGRSCAAMIAEMTRDA